jgi:tetratricopeptide (TPR) repeat protein
LFAFSLATALYRDGKLKEALESYKRCTELNPRNDLYFEKAARTLS